MDTVSVMKGGTETASEVVADLHSNAVRRLRKVPNTTPVDEILSIYHRDGGVIIQNFISSDQVRAFNADLDPHLNGLSAGAPRETIDDRAADFFGRATKRLMGVAELSKTFREDVLEVDLVHAIGDMVFSENEETYWLATAQVIEICPGNVAQELHRDIDNWRHFHDLGPSGPDVIISFMVALTDFTDENGATRFLPGTQHQDFAIEGDPSKTIPVEMDAGDALLFSAKVIHGGGANRTKSESRRSLGMALMAGFLTPEEAFPLTTSLETVKTLSPRAQRLMGFRSHRTTRRFFGWRNLTTWGQSSASMSRPDTLTIETSLRHRSAPAGRCFDRGRRGRGPKWRMGCLPRSRSRTNCHVHAV